MPTTEIAVFPLKAGSNPGDPDSVAGKVLKNTFDTLSTIDGLQQVQFGKRRQHPASNFSNMTQVCESKTLLFSTSWSVSIAPRRLRNCSIQSLIVGDV